MWEYIDILKRKEKKEENIQILTRKAKILSKEEPVELLQEFWGEEIYKMHKKKTKLTWNENEIKDYEINLEMNTDEDYMEMSTLWS